MNIGVDNPALAELQHHLAKLGQGSMPATAGALNSGAGLVRDTWQGFAKGGSLPGISESLKHPNGGYARSIRVDKIGAFQYEIFSEAQIAEWIEKGTPEHDMKTTHPFGQRSRMSKEGFPYLIIPFRWGNPKAIGFRNVMPKSVYNIVKNKKKFRQTKALWDNDKNKSSTHPEKNAFGNYEKNGHQQVERQNYSGADGKGDWGDRLNSSMGEDVTQNMEGMSSMLGQDGKASGYLTFRVISAKQLITKPYSWIKPAMPARNVTKAVADYTKPVIEALVDSAIAEDL
jgi:hypothetical protein